MKKNQLFTIILIVIISGVFVFAAYKLINIFVEYQVAIDNYNEGKEEFASKATRGTKPTEETEDTKAEETEYPDYSMFEVEEPLKFMHTTFDYLIIPEYELDFEGLQAKNPDVCAWITIEGTNIDYPIVQGDDNSYYLRRTAYGEPNNAGSIFLDYRNSLNFDDFNAVLYGHNQRNGVMFHELTLFMKEDFRNEHRYIKVHLPNGELLLYRIFACYENSNTVIYRTYFHGEDEKTKYLDAIYESYGQDLDFNVTTNSNILTLCTCTDRYEETYRVIVQAELINRSSLY